MIKLPFNVSAPAKIILHGEYAVVFGKVTSQLDFHNSTLSLLNCPGFFPPQAAIALSAGLYTNVKVERNSIENQLKLNLHDFNFETSWDVSELLSLPFKGTDCHAWES